MEKKSDTVSSRLVQFVDYLGFSGREFERSVGMSHGMISKMRLEKTAFSVDFAEKVLEVYPQLNPVWLMTGKEEMLVVNKTDNLPKDSVDAQIINEYGIPPLTSYAAEDPIFYYPYEEIAKHKADAFKEINQKVNPIVVTVDSHNRDNIVLVDQKAAAGYPTNIDNTNYFQKLPAFSLPSKKFKNATFRAFEVSGNSMEATLYSGDIVIASYVDNWPSNIKDGYIYVVITKDSVQVKRVLNRVYERKKIVIQSDNESWSTTEIDAEDVLQLWYVNAHIGFHMPNTKFSANQKIGKLEADYIDLESRLKHLEQMMKQIH